MFARIKAFFARLFGFGPDAETNDPVASSSRSRGLGPQDEEGSPDQPEDAADLGDAPVVHIEEAPTHMRSRSMSPAGAGGSAPGLSSIEVISPRYLWCLDNGHGREQPGKRSPLFADGTRFEEWECNRDIVRRIMKVLDERGVQYFQVVPEDDIGSFTRGRSERANEKESLLGLPKLFVSVHANAFGMSEWANGKKGIETWHFPQSQNGIKLASVFQRELMKQLPTWRDRGIKSHTPGSRKIFTVLSVPTMPAVLTENGFYTDEEEAALLMTDEIRQRIAIAHINAILEVEQNGLDDIETYRPNMMIG
jgi:N-acetylmuramoyl-L-alanine amidase